MTIPKHDNLLDSLFSVKNPFEEIQSLFGDPSKSKSIELDNNDKWSNLPGGYGTYCGDLGKLSNPAILNAWPLITSVLDEGKFKNKENRDSLSLAEYIINQPAYNNKRYTTRSAEGKVNAIQVYNINTGTFINDVIRGLLYTIGALKEGTPIVFGVNCQPYAAADNIDDSTNHYIIIVGMGNDGQNYLLGWDIICLLSNSEKNNDGLSPINKIYLDVSWPGLLKANNSWPNFYASARQPYKVTQILRTFAL